MKEKKLIRELYDRFGKSEASVVDNLRNAIEKLSEDLYHKKSHFIFELIQNAEDNNYDNEKEPFIKFSLQHKSQPLLLVENNEKGFSEENVTAICNVGRSTKKNKVGYIGQKGIGFKSVFKVTERPHIFSGNFAFSLPREIKELNIGYIAPIWCDKPPVEIDHDVTTIALPLMDGRKGDIRSELNDLAPETILFLKKIQNLGIHFNSLTENSSIVFSKESKEAEGQVSLYVTRDEGRGPIKSSFEFYLASETFDIPEDCLDEARQGITQAELTIAIPLTTRLEKVFAYLPVWEEGTGLPFIINSDFILSASRENMHVDNPWNLFLRDQIARVYTKALLQGMNDTSLTIRQKLMLLQSLPVNTGNSFLEPVIGQIKDLLAEAQFIPTIKGTLIRASEARIADADFYKLFCSSKNMPVQVSESETLVPGELLGLKDLLAEYGLERLEDDCVADYLKDQEWLKSQNYQWFCNLFCWLSELDLSAYALSDVSLIPVQAKDAGITLANGNELLIYWIEDQDPETFFSKISDNIKASIDIHYVDQQFWERFLATENCNNIKSFFNDYLRVYDFTIHNYCVDVLNYLSNKYEELDHDEIINYSQFLSENEQHLSDNYTWDQLPLVLSDGKRILLENTSELIEPEYFDASKSWAHIWALPSERLHFEYLHNDYKRFKRSWFKKLGIKRYPAFKINTHKYYETSNIENSEEKNLLKACLDKSARIHIDEACINRPVLTDCLIKLKAGKSLTSEQSSSLLDCISSYFNGKNLKNPEDYFKIGLKTQGIYENRGEKDDYCESGLAFVLKNYPWLPTNKGLQIPSRVFIRKKDTLDLLGETVSYYEGPQLPDTLIAFFSIRNSITLNESLNLLECESKLADCNPDLCKRIYLKLNSYRQNAESSAQIKRFFSNTAVILVPLEGNIRWARTKDCIWEDASEIFGTEFAYLSKYYKDLKDFFVEVVGVKKDVDAEAYARQLLNICYNPEKYSNLDTEKTVTKIYEELISAVSRNSVEKPLWWQTFARRVRILSKAGSFEPTNNILFSNMREIEGLFKDQVKFAFVPKSRNQKIWQDFFEMLGVEIASDCIYSEFDQNSISEYLQLPAPDYCTPSMVKMLAIAVNEKEDGRHFKRLMKEEKLKKLLQAKEYSVNQNIPIAYTLDLNGEEYFAHTEKAAIFVDDEDLEIYFSKSAEPDEVKRQLAKEIAEYIWPEKYEEFRDRIETLLCSKDCRRTDDENKFAPPEFDELMTSILAVQPELEDEAAVQDTIIKDAENQEMGENTQPVDIKQETTLEPAGLVMTQSVDDQPENQGIPKPGKPAIKQSRPDVPFQLNRPAHSIETDNDDSDELSFDDLLEEHRSANPQRRAEKRQEKTRQSIAREPSDAAERRRSVESSILEPADSRIREQLQQWYSGYCQICKKTWKQQNNNNFFVAAYMLERKNARFADNNGNTLSLCAEHFAKFRLAARNVPPPEELIKTLQRQIDENKTAIVFQIRLNHEACEVTMNQQHAVDMIAFWQELQNADSDKTETAKIAVNSDD